MARPARRLGRRGESDLGTAKDVMARSSKAAPQGASIAPRETQEEGNRKAELVRAAGRLFREKGYEATTIRDIADAVGMRSGSPFYHFKSKQDMLKAVMLEGLEQVRRAIEDAAARKRSPKEKLRAMVRAHLATILGPGADFVPVLLYEWRALPDEMRTDIIAVKDRYEAIWDAMLRELKQAGLLHKDDKVTRLFLLGALNWVVQWYRPGERYSIEEIAGRAVEFVLPQTGEAR
jgi:AcrR family transcriptional regulator